MTLQQLDEALQLWEAELGTVASDLLALQADSTYQAMAGLGGCSPRPTAGETARLSRVVLQGVPALLEHFSRLQVRVGQAEAVRRGLPSFFGTEARLREAERSLAERSLAVDRVVAGRFADDRQGTDQAVLMTPGELLSCLREGVLAIASRLRQLSEAQETFEQACAAIAAELDQLRGQALVPSGTMQPVLAALEVRCMAARDVAATDPLEAAALLMRETRPLLLRARALCDDASDLYQQLAAASVRWGELERAHAEAVALGQQAQSRIAEDGQGAAPAAEDKVQGLGLWLEKLRQKADEGTLTAVGVGLRHWTAAADAVVAQDRRAAARCAQQMELRGELRGRLRALKAKAEAVQGRLDRQTAELAGRAEALLYSAPLELGQASAAVAALEHSLQTGQTASPVARP